MHAHNRRAKAIRTQTSLHPRRRVGAWTWRWGYTAAVTLLAIALLVPGWTAAEAAARAGDEASRAAADAQLAGVVGDDVAAAAYKRGWLAQRFDRRREAIDHFARCVALDPSGRYAARARLQARALSADATARHARFDAAREAFAADEAQDLRLRVFANIGAALVLSSLVVVFVLRRGWRGLRRARPWRGAAFAIYAFTGGALFSEAGWGVPLLCCGLAVAAVHTLAASARAVEVGEPRWADGFIAALATLAACYVVLAAFDRQAVLGL